MVCIMVGLPARGKTYVSRKLSLYFSWLGYETRSFNVGSYRRAKYGSDKKHEFFDPHNEQGREMRHQAASAAMADLITWLDASLQTDSTSDNQGRLAIYDATNSTRERREWILTRLLLDLRLSSQDIVFVELVCNDPTIIQSNILQVKLNSPDYRQEQDPDAAVADFEKRIEHYMSSYQTIQEHEYDQVQKFSQHLPIPFIKNINVGTKMILRGCSEYWQCRIAFYLMNLHITPRVVYLCRHGESELNVQGRIGGDANLSEHGLEFARTLPGWVSDHFGTGKALTVWTSSLKRTIQTAQFLPYPKIARKALDELYAGKCDGLTYNEIEDLYPTDFHARDCDKYHYRYPDGESYADLVLRLEPIMLELEHNTNILIIGHQAILRVIYAYFMGLNQHDLPYVKIPLHTMIELCSTAYSCDAKFHPVGIPAVNTHREKPADA